MWFGQRCRDVKKEDLSGSIGGIMNSETTHFDKLYYTAEQCLAGWRAVIDPDRSHKPKSLAKPSSKPSPAFAQFIRVETWWGARPELHHLRPFAMMADQTSDQLRAAMAEFATWYESHRLPLGIDYGQERHIDPKHVPDTISNIAAHLDVNRWTLYKACQRGNLYAWKPAGSQWISCIAIVEKYVNETKMGRPRKAA